MTMVLAPPTRLDLAIRRNDDKTIALAWVALDQITPIAIAVAKVTLRFDDTAPVAPATTPTPGTVITIISTTPGDNAGWIDDTQWPNGVLLCVMPHALWVTHADTGNFGRWEAVAVSEVSGIQRVLARGEFVLEEGGWA